MIRSAGLCSYALYVSIYRAASRWLEEGKEGEKLAQNEDMHTSMQGLTSDQMPNKDELLFEVLVLGHPMKFVSYGQFGEEGERGVESTTSTKQSKTRSL